MRTILVTGGAGFIGSNFVEFILNVDPSIRIINIDALTYAGSLKNIEGIMDNPRHKFVHGDICNRELVAFLFREYDVTGVVHFAAESHVDNSIKNPGIFIKTNVDGTHSLLDAAYRYWMDGPFQWKEVFSNARFLHISTDEVYGSLGESGFFVETTPYDPSSPYSASKAASDMIVRSYFRTYGMNVAITNCSNNYGPRQHDEKLIPTIIRNALQGRPIPIYGDGLNVRDWLYVEDHCRALRAVFTGAEPGDTFNIGGGNERTNLQVATTICVILDNLKPRNTGKYADLITLVNDRPGHDRRYAIDATKIEGRLGWLPEESFDSGFSKTVQWYLERYSTTE